MTSVSNPDSPPQNASVQEGEDPRMAERRAERERLRISRFDVVTSFFMALILFIGTFTLMLFIIWLTTRWTFPAKPIVAPIERPEGTENPEGFERDFEPPGAEEVEELMEPTLQDTIEAVTDAVSNVAAALVTADTQQTATTQGTGRGDSRRPGKEGEGDDVVPRYERWQLNFTARDERSYARQLDYYGIELGAIGGSIQGVDVAKNLSGNKQTYRITDTASEKRLYFMFNRPSPLQQYDMSLLSQASIPLSGRQTLKFIPKELENQLYQLEMQYAQEKGYPSVTQIAKTVFESKADGSDYEFEVVSQRYRKNKIK